MVFLNSQSKVCVSKYGGKKFFFNDNSKFEEIGLVGFDVKYIVNRYRL